MTTTNWAGNLTYGATTLHTPTSVEQLQQIVRDANRLRAVGSRHSFNRIADTDAAQVSVAGLPSTVDVDELSRTVTVSAGLRYGELVDRLDAAGWAVPNLASLPHISVAGAIATGTHGSGDGNVSLAGAVAGVRLVGADGELHDIRRGDPDFEGAVVSLGRLGIVTQVTIDAVPTFEVRQDLFEHLPWSDVETSFDAITSSAYSVSMFTDWSDRGPHQVWTKSRVDDGPVTELLGARLATRELHPLPGVDPGATTRQLGVPGPWWDRLPHFRLEYTPSDGDELQTEYLVPRSSALDAIRAVRGLHDRLEPILLVAEIRTIAADGLWLSPSHDVDCVALHFTWRMDVPRVEQFLPVLDDALAPFAARPHWGKVFETTPERLLAAYPRLPEFAALVGRRDPDGVFANELTDRWLTR
ncbi:FAD-binding protein [Aeromicrobium fastidiosum]|uniref:FAD-binding protein n=1 Tax=Aeromicrobium fastidiosum TaxID=52699 RepID=A0A641AMZ3_9ACTN|nr:FAD-binding protein [Aeromicrobium fastidiosum]KAA1378236.1 FAD-binding protein [Aeromicrobium fastidiosum]MBP2388949.1 xylitol oxidase [Aeromicrobium fastidiosum]